MLRTSADNRPASPLAPRAGSGATGLGGFAGDPPYTASDLAAALEAMEITVIFDHGSVLGPAACAEQLALELGRTELAMRARLLGADARCRQGDVVAAAGTATTVNSWAAEHADGYLLARSHRQLSIVFRIIGDRAESLTHAVRAVAHTGDDVAPRIRVSHLLALGVALNMNKSVDEAYRRFAEALTITGAIGDAELSMTVLNNMAYGAYDHGDRDRAREFAARMNALRARHQVRMYGHYLDTLARVELMQGHFAEAERILLPVLDDPTGALFVEGDALSDCLLTIAEAQRMLGALDRAQATLHRAARVAQERALTQAAVQVRREQAQLHAAMGNYREAYQEYRRFHQEWVALQNVEREVRARVVQAVFETEEARLASIRFREMALRDSLTGLYNRRYVDERLPALLARAAELAQPLSAALLDLDFFKRINDTLCHDAGDLVLRQVASLLAGAVDESVTVARMGGEEFVLLFPNTDEQTAVAHCERIRRVVRAYRWRSVTGGLPVTVSIGITTTRGPGTTPSALLTAADRNLYAAKRAGRDRVVGDPPTAAERAAQPAS